MVSQFATSDENFADGSVASHILIFVKVPVAADFRETMHRTTRSYRLFWRILHFGLLLVLAWCVMVFTHEAGHLLGGWCSGGTLNSADLWPWHLPFSTFEPDPFPLVTLWGGPLLGTILPVVVACRVRRDWIWFIAWFCVLANGVYLAAAWWSGDRYLDTPRLLEHGASPVSIAIFCVLTIGSGYAGFRRRCLQMFSPPQAALAKKKPGQDSDQAGD